MSLKARIEAVIYAAEEPVTLAQLSVLFGEEALEQKLAREAKDELASEAEEVGEAFAADRTTETETEAGTEIASALTAAEGEIEQDLATTAELAPEVLVELAVEETRSAGPQEDSVEEEQSEAASQAEPNLEDAATSELSAAEIDEKKLARQREREIREELRLTLDELMADYAQSERGMEIREVAGGYRIGTRPEYHDAVRAFVKSLKPAMKLSLQALETLAVIAYKQPVTAPEVGEIRGVDSAGVIGSLISRKLVTTAGRKQVIGRPILYKTTKEFLLRFGMRDLNELPSMEEFEKMAGELAESAETEPLPFTEERQAPEDQSPQDEPPVESEQSSTDELNDTTLEESAETIVAEGFTNTVEVPGPAGRARVEVRMDHHDDEAAAITLTDESRIFTDLPGVALTGAELGTTETEADENQPENEPKEEPRG